MGILSLPENPKLLLIDDGELARSLLERAWTARMPASTPLEVEDHEWVAKACSLQ